MVSCSFFLSGRLLVGSGGAPRPKWYPLCFFFTMNTDQETPNGASQEVPVLQVTSAAQSIVKYNRRESTNQDDSDHNSFVSLSSHTSTPFDSILATHATNLRAEVDNIKMNLCFHVKVKQEEFALVTPSSIKQCGVLNKFTLATSLLSLLDLSEKVCATISGCRLSDTDANANASHVVRTESPTKDPIKAIHESIKEIKNSHANEASRFQNLEKQMEEMKQCISQLTKPLSDASTPDLLNPPPPAFPVHLSRRPPITETVSQISPALRNRNVDAVKMYTDNFLESDLSAELLSFLNEQNDEFEKNTENGHSVISYGQPYKYVGAGAPAPKSSDFPDPIAKVVDLLKQKNPDCVINQCLVNRYSSESSFLAEHSDDEKCIVHGSDIYTVSVGGACEVKFRNIHDPDEEVVQKVSGNSLYVMSKLSQSSWKHRIDQSEEKRELRYSITFRYISQNTSDATIICGDSNTRFLKFGTGKGTFGEKLPGKRVLAFTIDQIDPIKCDGYKNVFIHCGINDIRHHGADAISCANALITKLDQICEVCPTSKVVVSPILPTRLTHLNEKAKIFNRVLFDYINNCNPRVGSLDFNGFVDESNLLDKKFLRYRDPSDPIHLGSNGIFTLSRLILSKARANFVDGRKFNDIVAREVNQRPPNRRRSVILPHD